MKRFWKSVSIEAGVILLDGKPIRTPGRLPLAVPYPPLAEAIAEEWRAVGDDIDPHAMRLTGLANAAIELVPADPATFASSIAAYGETDLLCYRAEAPAPLVARQEAVWDPLLAWARRRYDVAFVVTAGIIHRPQPAETVARLAAATAARNAFELAALSPLVTIGGSLVLGLMLLEGAIAPEAAFDAAHLDALWQAEMWGEDAEARQLRDAHRRDFFSAARFLALLVSA